MSTTPEQIEPLALDRPPGHGHRCCGQHHHFLPINSDAPRARRPSYSVRDKSSAWRDFASTGQPWRVCLRRMLKELIIRP